MRRSNPFGLNIRSVMGLARVGLFAGLGIVVARMAGGFYTKHIGSAIAGGAGATGTRGILSEVVRLFFMGAAVMVTGEAVVRRISQADASSYQVGGMAEVGRQGIGLIVQRVAPDKVASLGLGAAASGYSEMRVGEDGQVYGKRRTDGKWFIIGRQTSALSGPMESETFGGPMDAETFGAPTYDNPYYDDAQEQSN